ncbi:hypothetical protein H4W30_004737 [Amycolatopsis roodepoortensis]|uniref:Uncharacterized protein n=1 Tax=Amycolatopsis roodepoortensis TaxID=700274 RepID=A0ABR9LBH5_9PSEU|nr:hypothetical protein [Amycolatopsis roodepoortensis]
MVLRPGVNTRTQCGVGQQDRPRGSVRGTGAAGEVVDRLDPPPGRSDQTAAAGGPAGRRRPRRQHPRVRPGPQAVLAEVPRRGPSGDVAGREQCSSGGPRRCAGDSCDRCPAVVTNTFFTINYCESISPYESSSQNSS